jgi:hypothetical protein
MSVCETRELIQNIDIDECIGNSLIKITTNTSLLEVDTCTAQTDVSSVKNDFTQFQTLITNLSGTEERFAKATVAFLGNSFGNGFGLRDVVSTYNVASVSSLGIGRYAIYFTEPLANTNYALVGSSQSASVHPTLFTTTSAVINILNPTGSLVDSNYISLLVYNK